MSRLFGTDGIRGIANEGLTPEIAMHCGNALSSLKSKAVVVVGRDTRSSGDMLSLSLAGGATSGGATVIDLGIVPTAGVAYLTRKFNADFGVVISASHNPNEYNGIKVFDKNGYKLSEKDENEIENLMRFHKYAAPGEIGRYIYNSEARWDYANYLAETSSGDLSGMKIVLDCSNGAAFRIAPEVFRRLNADVVALSCGSSGCDINLECGSLHPEKLRIAVLEHHADAGFAYDGDADRLVAVDEKGSLVDGDMLIYMLSVSLQKQKLLRGNKVVGTSHTNMGVQKALAESGITLLRSDIGDKYVIEMMLKENCVIGGEQSGHIILKHHSTTGDGILSSIQVANLIKREGKTLSELNAVKLFPQHNINVRVKEKLRILNNEQLADALESERMKLHGKGRIVLRASGTEELIRVFAESEDGALAKSSAERVAAFVRELDELS